MDGPYCFQHKIQSLVLIQRTWDTDDNVREPPAEAKYVCLRAIGANEEGQAVSKIDAPIEDSERSAAAVPWPQVSDVTGTHGVNGCITENVPIWK